ncbi:MAG: rod shape-determining protein [Oscillospiraceae bacterium]|nr:rod shape-determining protein [Oscillospiraceae bacterium]
MALFTKSIGIDLGTANTLVYMKGRGILLREPSVVAIETKSKKVLAVGNEAKNMLGKAPDTIEVFRPLKDGVIAEFEVTAKMLNAFFKRVTGVIFLNRPEVIICVPYGVTDVEKRAVEDATIAAGAKRVAIIEEPVAAAIGASLKVSAAHGSMIVDIGGGTTEVAVLSLGGIVVPNSIRVAGDSLDEAIMAYVRKEHNVLIGESTAELVKKTIGAVHPDIQTEQIEIRGRNLYSGLPAKLILTTPDVINAMNEPINQIVTAIKRTLERTPPELAADIYDSGIMCSGGGALLKGLAPLLQEETGIKTYIAKRPLDCVVDGIGAVLDDLESLSGVLSYVKSR